MRLSNTSLISNSLDMTSSFELNGFWLGHIYNYMIQLEFSGSPHGTFKLQGSIEDSNPILWTDIANSQQSITESGTHGWNAREIGYRWVRIVWTASSGSGTLIKAILNAKGV